LTIVDERYDVDLLSAVPEFLEYEPAKPLTRADLIREFHEEWRYSHKGSEMHASPIDSDTIADEVNRTYHTEESGPLVTETSIAPFVLEATYRMYEKYGEEGILFVASHLTDRPFTKVLNQIGWSKETMGLLPFEAKRKKIERSLKQKNDEMMATMKAALAER
jgi:hypothetical protein